jgi:hypothetical protein
VRRLERTTAGEGGGARLGQRSGDARLGRRPVESPSLVLVINDTKLLMPLCQVV